MSIHIDAETAALRLIVSNLVARIAGRREDGASTLLSEMADQCKLAAEQMSVGPERTALVRETQLYLDEFFKSITIT